MKPDALPSHAAQLEAAYRHSAALVAAMHRHACWCGAFGPFRFAPGGSWFCAEHVERDAGRVPVRGIKQEEVSS